jgi:hypothetical protein
VVIPSDWSGQYGWLSEEGGVIWNRDWAMGPILFDGTFTYYPVRYGPAYFRTYRPLSPGDFNSSAVMPDSAYVTSAFDYQKGDYQFDQLELSAHFGEAERLTRWLGFKRDYAGRLGQFLLPSGQVTPIQQSYQLDYQSRQGKDRLGVAVVHLVTNSGLWDTAGFGRWDDRITAAGADYVHSGESSRWWVQGSQFNQKYFIDHSAHPEFRTQYLNRGRLHFRWARVGSTRTAFVGVTQDWQGLRSTDQPLKQRDWSTLYAGYEAPAWSLRAGATIAGVRDLGPYAEIRYQPWQGVYSLKVELSAVSQPKHVVQWSAATRKMLEQWVTGAVRFRHTAPHLEWGAAVRMTVVANFRELNRYLLPVSKSTAQPGWFSAAVSGRWEFVRRWWLAGDWRHTESNSSLWDGIGDRLFLSLEGEESFFRRHLTATLRFTLEGLLNRDTRFAFDPFYGLPYRSDQPIPEVSDYWVAHLSVRARVSRVTLSWSVYNLLNALEPSLNRLVSDLPRENLWPRNSAYFQPMGRLVSFGVLWNFEQ